MSNKTRKKPIDIATPASIPNCSVATILVKPDRMSASLIKNGWIAVVKAVKRHLYKRSPIVKLLLEIVLFYKGMRRIIGLVEKVYSIVFELVIKCLQNNKKPTKSASFMLAAKLFN